MSHFLRKKILYNKLDVNIKIEAAYKNYKSLPVS